MGNTTLELTERLCAMEESQEDNEVEEIVQRLAFDAEAATRGIASSPQLEERPSSEEGSAPTQKDVKKLESENEDLREEIEELDGGSRPSRRSVREDAVEGVIEAMLVGPLEKEAFQEEIHRLQEAAHIAQRQASHLEARTEELSLAAIENAADVADSTLDCLLKDLEAVCSFDLWPLTVTLVTLAHTAIIRAAQARR